MNRGAIEVTDILHGAFHGAFMDGQKRRFRHRFTHDAVRLGTFLSIDGIIIVS
jgi:hypothetical protein